MSMSAEEILLNCKKQFEFIKTDINTLLAYIQELLEECHQIDNSNFYTEKLESLIKKVKDEILDLQKADDYAKEVEGQTHVATERYHEIQRYAERKRELIAEFKAEVFALKKDITVKEQDAMVKNLNDSLYNSFDDLKREIINFYETVDDRTIIQNYFNEFETVLRNKDKSQLLEIVANHLNEQKQSTKFITKQMINSSIQLYDNDKDVVNAIKDDAKVFLTESNDSNLFDQAKQFFIKASKSAENEAIRKDNVIKIVNAIRAVGYIVDENNIRKLEEKNLILIHGEKVTGETADFAVRLDGSFVYNYEGFEGHEHDVDADAFLQKLREQGIQSSEEFNKQYREPKYIAKNKAIINNKKTNSSK
ncbi:hypothetical protein [Spiroplasma culicicola]|uniref:Uncharacterized protein n=1 Tax=Spiroplasma culicicola AES-1 TaxID=1276246 RepID=W6A699_9MOLU|nr:hypothetical protein [Spiroplasma culicicola]AHI52522.1 hypothetical protein SCULI_v1c01810 [Spiroplasma culicicola AES-1]